MHPGMTSYSRRGRRERVWVPLDDEVVAREKSTDAGDRETKKRRTVDDVREVRRDLLPLRTQTSPLPPREQRWEYWPPASPAMDEPGAVLGQNIWRAWPLPFPSLPSLPPLLPFSPIRSRPFKYRGSTDIKSGRVRTQGPVESRRLWSATIITKYTLRYLRIIRASYVIRDVTVVAITILYRLVKYISKKCWKHYFKRRLINRLTYT